MKPTIRTKTPSPLTRESLTLASAEKRDKENRGKLKELLESVLEGKLVSLASETETRGFNFHACMFDKECWSLGVRSRMHLRTPRWNFDLALTPGERFPEDVSSIVSVGGFFQISPSHQNTCGCITALKFEGELLVDYALCPLKLGHKGGCWDWWEAARVNEPKITRVVPFEDA